MRFGPQSLSLGVQTHTVDDVSVPIFEPAKTVVDCFRFRQHVGLDVALEGLHNVIRSGKVKPAQIVRYCPRYPHLVRSATLSENRGRRWRVNRGMSPHRYVRDCKTSPGSNRPISSACLPGMPLNGFIFRLSVSPHKKLFVLKGAMLYAAWLPDPFRTTRDLDLLSFADRETAPLLEFFRNICAQPVADDGLRFGTANILAEPTGDDRTHGALRVRTSAQLAAAIIPLQIDVRFGDAVTPGPLELEYPVLLDHPAPTLNAYPRDTVATEKFEAIVALDLANSRMKDFYDLLAMSRLFAFEGVTLAAAIRATFERRATAVPRECPPSLTHAFSDDPQKLSPVAIVSRPRPAVDRRA